METQVLLIDEAIMELVGLYKFIRYFGSQQAAADAIGVRQQAISNWLVRGKIPYKQVLRIVCVTNGLIKPHDLAPEEKEMNKILDDLIRMSGNILLENQCEPQLILPNQINHSLAANLISRIEEMDFYDLEKYEILRPLCKQALKTLTLTNKEGKKMMRDYSKISPQFWVGRTGREIRQLGLESRMLALYLLTCPHANMLGIYYLPIAYIVHDAEMNTESVVCALDKLNEIGFCTYDKSAEYVWVHEMAKHQISDQLDERDKRVKAVNDIFHSLPELSFLKDFYYKYKDVFHLQPRNEEFTNQDEILENSFTTTVVNEKNYPSEGASKPLRSQEQEQEQKQEQEQEQEKGEQEQKGKHRKALKHRHDDSAETVEVPASAIPPLSFVITIPLRGGSEFSITQVMIDEWSQLYPSADILQQLKNIRGWNLANPNKRKSRQGILQHINQWLAKENSKPAKSSVLEKPGGFNLFEHNTQVANAWLDQDEACFNGLPNERE